MRVVTTPEADVQIDAADDWWRENRPLAPTMFCNEFEHAIRLLRDTPLLGVVSDEPKVPGLRRLLLARTRYHVFYVVDTAQRELVILSVWSAVRGRGPTLRTP